jgi:hypothetical protein
MNNKTIFYNNSFAGGSNAFIAAFDSSGNMLHINSISGIADEYIRDMASDSGGNIYFTGMSSGKVYVMQDSIETNTYGNFLGKISADRCVWIKTLKGDKEVRASSITLAENKMYVSGSFNSQAWFGSDTLKYKGSSADTLHRYNSFIIQCDTSGKYEALKSDFSSTDYANIGSIKYLDGFICGNGAFRNDVSMGGLKVSNNNGYGQFYFKTSSNFTSIATEKHHSDMFKTYPNPTSGILHFNASEEGYVDIYSLDGKKQFTFDYKPDSPNSINIMTLKRGAYIIHFNGKDNYGWQKIIKY